MPGRDRPGHCGPDCDTGAWAAAGNAALAPRSGVSALAVLVAAAMGVTDPEASADDVSGVPTRHSVRRRGDHQRDPQHQPDKQTPRARPSSAGRQPHSTRCTPSTPPYPGKPSPPRRPVPATAMRSIPVAGRVFITRTGKLLLASGSGGRAWTSNSRRDRSDRRRPSARLPAPGACGGASANSPSWSA